MSGAHLCSARPGHPCLICGAHVGSFWVVKELVAQLDNGEVDRIAQRVADVLEERAELGRVRAALERAAERQAEGKREEPEPPEATERRRRDLEDALRRAR